MYLKKKKKKKKKNYSTCATVFFSASCLISMSLFFIENLKLNIDMKKL
jgi:hypothetical protein